jgi:hypothetical protein
MSTFECAFLICYQLSPPSVTAKAVFFVEYCITASGSYFEAVMQTSGLFNIITLFVQISICVLQVYALRYFAMKIYTELIESKYTYPFVLGMEHSSSHSREELV